jgi:hypothetical protein
MPNLPDLSAAHTLAVQLREAEIRVMRIPAMARVTKLSEEVLTALSQSNPVFAPGVGNYVAMGGVRSGWLAPLDLLGQRVELPRQLAAALEQGCASSRHPWCGACWPLRDGRGHHGRCAARLVRLTGDGWASVLARCGMRRRALPGTLGGHGCRWW